MDKGVIVTMFRCKIYRYTHAVLIRRNIHIIGAISRIYTEEKSNETGLIEVGFDTNI